MFFVKILKQYNFFILNLQDCKKFKEKKFLILITNANNKF